MGSFQNWFVFSDSIKIGGVASAIFEALSPNAPSIESFELDTPFIEHGATNAVEERLGITPAQIAAKFLKGY